MSVGPKERTIARECALIVAQIDRQIIRAGSDPYINARDAEDLVRAFKRDDWARIALLAAVSPPTVQVTRLVLAVYIGRVLALDSLRAS